MGQIKHERNNGKGKFERNYSMGEIKHERSNGKGKFERNNGKDKFQQVSLNQVGPMHW